MLMMPMPRVGTLNVHDRTGSYYMVPLPNHERYTPDGRIEPIFRETVRDILNLDWSTRDESIFDELRRLKALEASRDGR